MASAAAARPLVAVRKIDSADATADQIKLPHVFTAPIRQDIVHFVHSNVAKNHRQAYAVSPGAGHQHSAESWGTGRAVARIPRVSGGGTSRAGQGAFANQCRKGRMFAPTKTWRRWHRKVNVNQKRFAVASALAASALPSLVMARGHKVEKIPEIPLVIEDSIESITKTKQAVAALETLGAMEDVLKSKDSRKLRCGKGKMRNRRHVQRRGPLIVYGEDAGIVRAFRNLPGVEIQSVDSLNILQLAPGGHLGRFIIWTKSAFSKLSQIYGSTTQEAAAKTGYFLPRSIVANADINRIINSDEIQSKLRPAKKLTLRYRLKKNPLKNLGVMCKLNPYALHMRRTELLSAERRKSSVEEARRVARALAHKKHRKQQGANYKALIDESRYVPREETRIEEDVSLGPAFVAVKKVRKEKKRKEEVVEEVAPVAEKKEEKKDDKKDKKDDKKDEKKDDKKDKKK